jgi:hypothetical protein
MRLRGSAQIDVTLCLCANAAVQISQSLDKSTHRDAGPGARVRPNPSLEPTRTGMALGPLPGVVHHPSSGPSTTPALAAQLKR